MSTVQLNMRCTGDDGFELNAHLAIPGSGITALYGPSGCGKSTLLDCIAGLREPEPGSTVRIGDTLWETGKAATPAWERELGYVFQDARLFEHLTVRGNLEYAIKRRKTQPNAATLEEVSGVLQLAPLLSRMPQTLSAGQKQRVAVARALLRSPVMLLMDEPMANLDHAARQTIMPALQAIASQWRIPILFVSHDIEEVSQLADYLVLMEHGEVTEHGAALELASKLDTRLSHEEQAAAIVLGEVAAQDDIFSLTHIATEEHILYVSQLTLPIGAKCRVRIPARDISLCRTRPPDSSILNILNVTVTEIEQTTAPRLLLRLALGSQYLLARITRKSLVDLNLTVGDEIYAQIKSVALLLETENQTKRLNPAGDSP